MKKSLLGLVIVAVTVAILSIFFVANYHRLNLEYIPFNGAFQAFNPVQKIFRGEVPGKDFNAYLGLGPTYLNFTLTYALGKTFAASQFSTYFLSLSIHYLVLLLLFIYVGFSFAQSAIASSTMIIFLSFVFDDVRLINEIVGPGSSNLNFRSFLPFLTSVIVLAILHTFQKSFLTYVLLGSLMGIQVFWSNDYGIPSSFNLLLLTIIYLMTQDKRAVLIKILISIIAAGIAFYLGGMIFTDGSLWQWVNMNFKDVANDQFWYFLWFNNNNKILSFFDLFKHSLLICFLAIIIFCLLVIMVKGYLSQKSLKYLLLVYITSTSVMAGLLSSLGGTMSVRYYLPSIVISFFILPLSIYLLFFRSIELKLTTGLMITLFFFYSLAILTHYHYSFSNFFAQKPEFVKVEELGGWLSSRWRSSVEIGKILKEELKNESPKKRMLSTYSTGMDTIIGAVNPTNIDYIIHALGDHNRNHYLQSLQEFKPRYITILREDYSPWETWVRRTNWWFYREFINNYKLVEGTFYNLIWQRQEQARKTGDYPAICEVSYLRDDLIQLTIDTLPSLNLKSDVYYLDLRLNYHLNTGNKRGLVNIIEVKTATNKSIGVTGNHSYGIPPGHNNWLITVEHQIGTKSIIQMKAYPEQNTKLELKLCQAQVLVPVNELSLTKEVDIANLNEKQWSRGILVNNEQTGVIINSDRLLPELAQGMELIFAGSGKRSILRIEDNQVFVDGTSLNPVSDGYPHSVKLRLR
ncbi:hypothetical protein [Gloeocapsa sp. PCC 73106]|uniref:hypothetical protein n=1 Tax=Gloeocapsa sp. PCC 73106 TaxID=102232 RepID=UPI0002AC0B28|nr:hypothetical protein [Gloeocapsa sp. PCC 73106]ELR97347.1 hypothetical protein GLO73106DRAFT_00011560 [Gloeocapsa sp. PCC 73106]